MSSTTVVSKEEWDRLLRKSDENRQLRRSLADYSRRISTLEAAMKEVVGRLQKALEPPKEVPPTEFWHDPS